MFRVFWCALAIACGSLIACESHAAELTYVRAGKPRCVEVRRCYPDGCRHEQVCYRCGYGSACASIYGAYGPWGGAAYWGQYSYRRPY